MKSSLLLAASLGTTLLISACQNVAVDTNVSPKNFEEYFKPSSVQVYDKKSILDHRYHSLGMVVGLACQEKPDDFVARDTEARLDALIQTADLGGNGIVYNKCIRLERTQSCYVSVTCYAEAFVVDDGKINPNAKNLQDTKKTPVSFDKAHQANNNTIVSNETETAKAASSVAVSSVAAPIDNALEPQQELMTTQKDPEIKAVTSQDEIPTFKIDDGGIENIYDRSAVDNRVTEPVESKQYQRRNRMYKIQLD